MIVTGKLIEYLDNGKFICALVTESQPKRLRLINQNGRELNLPLSRVVHCSKETHPTELSRESVTKHLQDTTEKRGSLMSHINLEEIWELTAEDGSNSFSPIFLAELIFGSEATDNTVSAFLRCIFEDKLFFKYKEGQVQVNSAEQVSKNVCKSFIKYSGTLFPLIISRTNCTFLSISWTGPNRSRTSTKW